MMEDKASPPPARLLIADDHDLARKGMRTMLARETDLEVVGEAENGREAVEACRFLDLDLVLMDVRMPEMDGLEATREIKEEYPETRVLMVTTHESPEYLLDAIRAGAAGYVLKEATKGELLSAIRRVLDGESPLNQELAMRLLRQLASDPDRPAEPPEPVEERQEEPPPGPQAGALTEQELVVLRLLARGETNREIAQELGVSLTTAKDRVQRVISKLGASDHTQAALRTILLGE